ncbi:hypothetical protein APA_603 [Pseudanabaena sp. lw0831]|nr:hypothetical protein APA_603 [Pseudanabaena sp. lw0831]
MKFLAADLKKSYNTTWKGTEYPHKTVRSLLKNPSLRIPSFHRSLL